MDRPPSRFQFYEVVVVLDCDDGNVMAMVGEEGTILGMAQDDDSHQWYYAVSMKATGVVWSFREQQLTSTGKHQERSDFYPGEVLKVKVDPKTGRGIVV